MTVTEIFKIWTSQWESGEVKAHGKYRFPEISYTVRELRRDWNEEDLATFKEYLLNQDTKWFVANFFAIQENIPTVLFEPLIVAAIREQDPSLNQDYINPCLRFFGFSEVFKHLDHQFEKGDNRIKIGVCKAYYWARSPLVKVTQGTESKLKGYKTKWNGHYYGDYDFDKEIYFEMSREEVAKCKETSDHRYSRRWKLLLQEFLDNRNIDVRYHIKLCLPGKLKQFGEENQDLAVAYFKELESRYIPSNLSDLSLRKRLGVLGDLPLLQFLYKERESGKTKDNLIYRK